MTSTRCPYEVLKKCNSRYHLKQPNGCYIYGCYIYKILKLFQLKKISCSKIRELQKTTFTFLNVFYISLKVFYIFQGKSDYCHNTYPTTAQQLFKQIVLLTVLLVTLGRTYRLVSLLLLGLNSVTLPLICPLRLDYQGLAQACCIFVELSVGKA